MRLVTQTPDEGATDRYGSSDGPQRVETGSGGSGRILGVFGGGPGVQEMDRTGLPLPISTFHHERGRHAFFRYHRIKRVATTIVDGAGSDERGSSARKHGLDAALFTPLTV